MSKTTYADFVSNYLVQDGMLGNAANLNKAPDQLKKELDENTASITNANLDRADIFLSSQNIANMIYDGSGNLIKIRYLTDTDTNYQILTYTSGNLTGIAHYVNSVLKGNSVLSYTNGNLVSDVFTAV